MLYNIYFKGYFLPTKYINSKYYYNPNLDRMATNQAIIISITDLNINPRRNIFKSNMLNHELFSTKELSPFFVDEIHLILVFHFINLINHTTNYHNIV